MSKFVTLSREKHPTVSFDSQPEQLVYRLPVSAPTLDRIDVQYGACAVVSVQNEFRENFYSKKVLLNSI